MWFLCLLLFLACCALAFLYKKGQKDLAGKDSEIAELDKHSVAKDTKIAELSKYQQIIDVELEVQNQRAEATYDCTLMQNEASEMHEGAKVTLREAKNQKADMVAEAVHNAGVVVANAKIRAEEIAGEAYEAKANYDTYKNGYEAMKRKVRSYGDEWLVPNESLLDVLAEDFSHKDAGQQLKVARDHTRAMIKEKVAAGCDYAENIRKTTAIAFVTDAFNGAVDTILARVRHDNYGVMKKKIQDAYHLVNLNGAAFRNARITQEFLTSRTNELVWAVRAMELQKQEKEEQREIKAQMREEERARREYERAISNAEKEERMLQKAMEKARKQINLANEEERSKLEEELQKLQEQLSEAEAKNQRAVSMAQQTRRGHVYVISNVGSFGEEVFKIGLTRRLEPLDRVKELGDASVPFSFDVHAMIYAEDAPTLEKELHRHFKSQQVNKVNHRKEFFKVSLEDIREAIDTREIEAKWTMKAEALEFRESIVIGKGETPEDAELIVAK